MAAVLACAASRSERMAAAACFGAYSCDLLGEWSGALGQLQRRPGGAAVGDVPESAVAAWQSASSQLCLLAKVVLEQASLPEKPPAAAPSKRQCCGLRSQEEAQQEGEEGPEELGRLSPRRVGRWRGWTRDSLGQVLAQLGSLYSEFGLFLDPLSLRQGTFDESLV
ncbi:unnamed protein product [Polarella glacialis]|uniref:Uncharacterized protein n=1 Tax=Polarella glacialis TaxID=89957 RepID=A0A813LV12_POLGL|nr:unnamed protein product [Polarella glacialis]